MMNSSVVKLVYGVDLGGSPEVCKFFYQLQPDITSLYRDHTDKIFEIYKELESKSVEKFFIKLISFEREYYNLNPVIDLCNYNYDVYHRRYILHPVQLSESGNNECIYTSLDSPLIVKNKQTKINKKTKKDFYDWLERVGAAEKFPIIVPNSYKLQWMAVSQNLAR